LLGNSVILLLSSVEKVRVRRWAVVGECYFAQVAAPTFLKATNKKTSTPRRY